MSDELKQIQGCVERLSNKIDALEASIRGDQLGNRGLAKRLKRIEESVDDLYQYRDRLWGIMLGVSGATGIVTGVVIWALTTIV